MESVTLSLISHTNAGKTTLLRTLLRQDVGEVGDAAHVTLETTRHVALESGDARLVLVDTPGIGDTARIARRLRHEGDLLGWLMKGWDRATDRAMYCSAEALKEARDGADVVLYVVDASQRPQDSAFVRMELELLAGFDRPTVILLNKADRGEADGDEAAWREASRHWPIVLEVLSLDAFTRCWVEECRLLERLAEVAAGERRLAEEKRAAFSRLAEAWCAARRGEFERSLAALAETLAAAAADREPLGGAAGKDARKRAMRALGDRLDRAVQELTAGWIETHGLAGRDRTAVEHRLDEDFDLPGRAAWSAGKSALMAAVAGGALGGVAADLATGGLSFGGGTVVGAVAAGMGALGLLRGYEFVRRGRDPAVGWTPDYLERVARELCVRYLAIAHFGRGRGEWEPGAAPQRWRDAVEDAGRERRRELVAALAAARADADGAGRVLPVVRALLLQVLRAAYPRCAHLLAER